MYSCNSFTNNFGPGLEIKEKFEQKYKCKINYISLKDSFAILNRLRLEGKNNTADIVIGLDQNLMKLAEKTGLFMKHDVDIKKINLPILWNNPIFMPFEYGCITFIYDKNKLKTPPKSLKDLVENKKIGNIIYENPRTSSLGFSFVYWIKKIYAHDSINVWKKLSKKTITITRTWSDAYVLFLKGEADLVLSYTTSPIYHIMKENKKNYVACIFPEGHVLKVSVVAQLKNSKNLQLAKKFMNFVLTPDFQEFIPKKNWMYPIIQKKLPKSYKEIIFPKNILNLDEILIEKNRLKWIKEWQEAINN
ncbi:thiamine ABC transporter substrate binding subunit [Candidatus Tachikawaea gelatinosa]|uniref:thiamine ABC transporter substrate binding subunit n=1 Tax=Candidatus Tachikawaea gelatinosa TaxID=1410383 RepID=UPI0038BA7233